MSNSVFKNNCTDDGNRARLRTDANRLKWKIIKVSEISLKLKIASEAHIEAASNSRSRTRNVLSSSAH